MVLNHPEEDFIFLFDRKPDPSFIFAKNVKPVIVYPPARHPILWKIWFQWAVPSVLKKHDAKLFISPDGFLPMQSEIPQLAVIHDLGFEHRPADLPPRVAKFYKRFFPEFAEKASRICTVSEFSKHDIIHTYKIPAEKIDVIYNGANEIFTPLNAKQQQEVRNELTAGNEYFIYVGSLHKRKNIVNLINGFDRFKMKRKSTTQLVIVGEKMFNSKEIDKTFDCMVYNDVVHFTGRISNEKLAKYVASAKALALLSHFEGFGIPVLEAMCCDVPVVVSQCSALTEIAGTAGFYVDQTSVRSISEAFFMVNTNSEVRDQLIENGRVERTRFSWDRSAEKMWASVQSCLAN